MRASAFSLQPSALLLLLLCWLLTGCAARTGPPIPVATLMPTPTGPPPPAEPTSAPTQAPVDSGWMAAGSALELRRLQVSLGSGQVAQVRIVRIDPAQVRFQVGYDPDHPRSITRWAQEYAALAAINGGFFDEQNRTVSLLVLGGQPVGASYSGRGAMFGVYQDGTVRLRGLADAPYDPSEPLAEAIQGWPLLVQPGGRLAYGFEDGERARRSALAIDRAGRVLLIVCSAPTFTLAELAGWLAGSDLEIDAAMNLDGGSSTGMVLRADTTSAQVDAFVPLPIVLLALPR